MLQGSEAARLPYVVCNTYCTGYTSCGARHTQRPAVSLYEKSRCHQHIILPQHSCLSKRRCTTLSMQRPPAKSWGSPATQTFSRNCNKCPTWGHNPIQIFVHHSNASCLCTEEQNLSHLQRVEQRLVFALLSVDTEETLCTVLQSGVSNSGNVQACVEKTCWHETRRLPKFRDSSSFVAQGFGPPKIPTLSLHRSLRTFGSPISYYWTSVPLQPNCKLVVLFGVSDATVVCVCVR